MTNNPILEAMAQTLCKRTDCQAVRLMDGDDLADCQFASSDCCSRFHLNDARAAAEVLLRKMMDPSDGVIGEACGHTDFMLPGVVGNRLEDHVREMRMAYRHILRAFAHDLGIEMEG